MSSLGLRCQQELLLSSAAHGQALPRCLLTTHADTRQTFGGYRYPVTAFGAGGREARPDRHSRGHKDCNGPLHVDYLSPTGQKSSCRRHWLASGRVLRRCKASLRKLRVEAPSCTSSLAEHRAPRGNALSTAARDDGRRTTDERTDGLEWTRQQQTRVQDAPCRG